MNTKTSLVDGDDMNHTINHLLTGLLLLGFNATGREIQVVVDANGKLLDLINP